MNGLASILEEEFALAFEVKDEKALRRSLTLLTSGMVVRDDYEKEQISLSSDVKLLAVKMDEGFRRMDERIVSMEERFESRFAAQDKRFEAVDSRFNRLTGLISLGFVVVTVLITIYQFL